jgi:serine/threonine protein kinase
MPPAALAWYGGVGTTAALSQMLVEFLEDFVAVQDNVKSLQLKVKDDLNLIDHFMNFIKNLPAGTTSNLDDSILDDLASHLQPLMIRCEVDVKRVRAATAGKTLVETYASRLAIRTIETLEKDLSDWVQRLNVRFTLLSAKLQRDAAKAVHDQDPVIRFQYAMQNLSSELNILRKESKAPAYADLWLPESQNIEFDGPPSKRRMGCLDNKMVLVEFISYNAAVSSEIAQNAIGELAFILHRSDPSIFHVLRCQNMYKHSSVNRSSQEYGLVFEIPHGLSTMRSLAEMVSEVKEVRGRSSYNLLAQNMPFDAKMLSKISSRVRLAYQLATGLHYLHSFGFVHQSLRTNNVLVATFETGTSMSGYISGFERSRPNAGSSNQKRSDADWKNNIYRSPERVATTDEEVIKRHTMSHDIYSLGVVLLELGLLEPLTAKESMFKGQNAQAVRENLLLLTKQELPLIMDDTYTSIVSFCLESTPNSWIASNIAEMRFVEEVIDPLLRLMKTK